MRSLAVTLCARAFPPRRGRQHPVVSLLQAAGHCATLVQDGRRDLCGTDLLWLDGNANWYPALCRQLLGMAPQRRPAVLVWHSEPLPPPRAAALPAPRLHLREIAKIVLRDARATDVYSNYFRLRQLARYKLPDVLVVSTAARRAFLAERGIQAHVVPLGYEPACGRDLGLERDIDTLFLGSLDVPRRRRLLRRLRRAGVGVLVRGDWSDPSTWGEARTRLLNRTKILLNLGRYPGELSGLRLILGLANKALVLSEPIYDPAPYVPGRHYVSAPIDEIPAAIAYYLAHADERRRIAAAGHRLVTEEVTLERSVAAILRIAAPHLRPNGDAMAGAAGVADGECAKDVAGGRQRCRQEGA